MLEHYYIIYPVLIIAGMFTGVINTLAGCGGAISLTVLTFLLPINIANATFRIPILLQNIVGVREFKKHKVYNKKDVLPLAVPVVLGGITGSVITFFVTTGDLRKFIGYMMFLLFGYMLVKLLLKYDKKKDNTQPSVQRSGYIRIFKYIVLFIVGMYGGFIQVGIGVFLLLVLEEFSSFEYFKLNGIKVLIILLYTIPVTIIFLCSDLIYWDYALVMAVGNMTGAKYGVKICKHIKVVYLKIFIIIILLLASIYYLS